jgi:hypothetical protein
MALLPIELVRSAGNYNKAAAQSMMRGDLMMREISDAG